MIYIWPDGSWVWASEYDEEGFRFKGNDFLQLEVPEFCDEDDADQLAHEITNSFGIPPATIVSNYFGLN